MEPTQIRRGSEFELLPAPVREVSAEAHQRAPTLMAVSALGEHGTVRVWSPDVESLHKLPGTVLRMSLCIVLVMAVPIAFVYWFREILGVPHHHLYSYFILLAALLTGPFAGYIRLLALRRPCYLTTDDAGIGITTRRGSRAIRWDDIESLNFRSMKSPEGFRQTLKLRSGDTIHFNLLCYSNADIEELKKMIIARARLRYSQKMHASEQYSRRRPALPPGR